VEEQLEGKVTKVRIHGNEALVLYRTTVGLFGLSDDPGIGRMEGGKPLGLDRRPVPPGAEQVAESRSRRPATTRRSSTKKPNGSKSGFAAVPAVAFRKRELSSLKGRVDNPPSFWLTFYPSGTPNLVWELRLSAVPVARWESGTTGIAGWHRS
jgi:hypothetical protein